MRPRRSRCSTARSTATGSRRRTRTSARSARTMALATRIGYGSRRAGGRRRLGGGARAAAAEAGKRSMLLAPAAAAGGAAGGPRRRAGVRGARAARAARPRPGPRARGGAAAARWRSTRRSPSSRAGARARRSRPGSTSCTAPRAGGLGRRGGAAGRPAAGADAGGRGGAGAPRGRPACEAGGAVSAAQAQPVADAGADAAAVDEYLAGRLLRRIPPSRRLGAHAAAGLPAADVSPLQGRLLELLARLQRARADPRDRDARRATRRSGSPAAAAGGALVTLEVDAAPRRVARANLDRAGRRRRASRSSSAPRSTRCRARRPVRPRLHRRRQAAATPTTSRWALRLSRPGTLIVVDNVVRGGAIADPAGDEPRVHGARRWSRRRGRAAAGRDRAPDRRRQGLGRNAARAGPRRVTISRAIAALATQK